MRPVSLSLQNRLRRPSAAEKGLTGSPISHTPSHTSSATSTPVPAIALSSVNAQHDVASGVKVFVRVRPFNEREKAQSAQMMVPIVKVDAAEPSHITLLDPKHDMRPKETYTFDHCFWSVVGSNDNTTAASSDGNFTPRPTSQPPYLTPPCASQADVYDLVGHSVLCNAIEGFNGCIFAYGQTGSGKTFTMMGYEPNAPAATVSTPVSRQPSSAILPGGSLATSRRSSAGPTTPRGMTPSNSECVLGGSTEEWETAKGIIPRIAYEIFETLSIKHNGDSTHSFRVELQYYEIYNEKVYDLFEPCNSNELRVRQDPLRGPFVDQLTTKCVDNQEAIAKLIKKGSYERHTAATKANERSSRSHAILTLTLVQMVLDENDCPQKMVSKMNLVDLAGSERTGLTGAEGQRFTEATKINLSLTTLGRVIDCLADQSTGKANGFTHCPYRESLLTWLLMDSIGGNSKTTMIATISPSMLNQEEIVQTLRYASRARQIVNKVVINEDPQTRRMKELTAEVERLGRIISESQMCPYSVQFVSELEESYRTAQGEITHLRQNNASLRCEVDILRTKKSMKTVVSTEDELNGGSQPMTRDASPTQLRHLHQHQRSESSSPLPSLGGPHPIYADPNAAGVPQRLFERSEAVANPSLQFTGSPMENCLRSRVRELTLAMQDMLKQQRSGVAASALRRHHRGSAAGIGDISIDSVASSTVSFDLDPQHGAQAAGTGSYGPAHEEEDIMSVEYVHMIEKLAQQLEQSEAALQAITKTQMEVFHADMNGIRDTVMIAEREHRERITTVASSVRSDIKTLIFRSNAATEKMIGDKAKEAASKKHAADIQLVEERWETRLAECRESFAAQIAEERALHESALRQAKEASAKEQKKVLCKEEERTRTGADAQKTIEELQAKLDAAALAHQKQLTHARMLHDKDKKKWEEETESKETRAGDMMRIAVADAHAKGRAAVEEVKKKKEAIAAERDCLAKRLALAEEKLSESVASSDAQKQSFAKREKQLQEWQRSLQTVEARELHSVTEQLTVTTRAREASHARHEVEVDSTKAAIEQLRASHQQELTEAHEQHAAEVKALEARAEELTERVTELTASSDATSAALSQSTAELASANLEVEQLREQLRIASNIAHSHGIEADEVRQQRASSQSRHESDSEILRQTHQEHVKAKNMSRLWRLSLRLSCKTQPLNMKLH
ncbi:kinesin, putative [Bodo saltans]|uniref:Kinesin, putative n=1 Tax=Bodo saltans TaxID=75058 RepID=A0A0S4IUW5_BODSA|nr:kinesin, putative [Bodo saltans]|eukprot:CUF74925.1 kinesin, putative [Bodo saltans]